MGEKRKGINNAKHKSGNRWNGLNFWKVETTNKGNPNSATLIKEIKFSLKSPNKEKDQPHVQGVAAAQAQEGQKELLYIQGQEGRPWGDSPHPR